MATQAELLRIAEEQFDTAPVTSISSPRKRELKPARDLYGIAEEEFATYQERKPVPHVATQTFWDTTKQFFTEDLPRYFTGGRKVTVSPQEIEQGQVQPEAPGQEIAQPPEETPAAEPEVTAQPEPQPGPGPLTAAREAMSAETAIGMMRPADTAIQKSLPRSTEIEPKIQERKLSIEADSVKASLLRAQIDSQKPIIEKKIQEIDALKAKLDPTKLDRTSKEAVEGYNSRVNEYNVKIKEVSPYFDLIKKYNSEIAKLSGNIEKFNQDVGIYQSIGMALEEKGGIKRVITKGREEAISAAPQDVSPAPGQVAEGQFPEQVTEGVSSLSAGPQRTLSDREKARDTNILSLAEATGLPPNFVKSHYDELTKEVGIRGVPTREELAGKLLEFGMSLGIPALPVAKHLKYAKGVATGVATFMGAKEAESVATQAAAGESPKLFQGRELRERLSLESETERTAADVAEFVLPATFAGKATKAFFDWYKTLTVKERGLVRLSLEDLMARGYKEAEIAKMSQGYWKEALARRNKGMEAPEPPIAKEAPAEMKAEAPEVKPEVKKEVKVEPERKAELEKIAEEVLTKSEPSAPAPSPESSPTSGFLPAPGAPSIKIKAEAKEAAGAATQGEIKQGDIVEHPGDGGKLQTEGVDRNLAPGERAGGGEAGGGDKLQEGGEIEKVEGEVKKEEPKVKITKAKIIPTREGVKAIPQEEEELPEKIYHFTRPENIPKILEEGFNTALPPIHGTGALNKRETYTAENKSGKDVLYFTTDKERWSKASVYVGEGKGTEDYSYFDYDTQKWVDEKKARTTIDLSPIEATIKKNSKILTLDSYQAYMDFQKKNLGDAYIKDRMAEVIDKAKELGYDILNVKHAAGKWDHPGGQKTKHGDLDWYTEATGSGGKNDFFILNKESIELAKKSAPAPAEKKGYYIIEAAQGERGTFKKVAGAPAKVEGLEDLDLFTYQRDDKFFVVTEGKTGMSMSPPKPTPSEAIWWLREYVEKNGKDQITKGIEGAIKAHGESPRYTGIEPPRPKQPWEMTREEWNSKIRFYRSGKTKNAEMPDGKKVILNQGATATNFREHSKKFFDSIRKDGIEAAVKQGKAVPKEVLDELEGLKGEKKEAPPKAEEKDFEKFKSDLDKFGAARIGKTDYKIQQNDSGGFYFSSVEDGIRVTHGPVGPAKGVGNWSRDYAVERALEDAGYVDKKQPVEPEPKKEPKFKLGDVVKVTAESGLNVGFGGRVQHVSSDGKIKTDKSGDAWIDQDKFELEKEEKTNVIPGLKEVAISPDLEYERFLDGLTEEQKQKASAFITKNPRNPLAQIKAIKKELGITEAPLTKPEKEPTIKAGGPSNEGAVRGEPAQRSDVEGTSGVAPGEPARKGEGALPERKPEAVSGPEGGTGNLETGGSPKEGAAPRSGRGSRKGGSDLAPEQPESAEGESGAPAGEAGAADTDLGGRELPRQRSRNNRIEPEDVLFHSGKQARIKANINAVELLKDLEKEDRLPTPEERKILQQYSGWGAVTQDVFRPEFLNFVRRYSRTYTPEGWFTDPKELKNYLSWKKNIADRLAPELKGALTEEEWKSAEDSGLNAHYTSPEVIKSGLWGPATRLGFKSGTVLEPAAGIGHIFGLMPENLANKASVNLMGVELDSISGRILKKLYPDADIQVTGFETATGIPDNSVDLVISNFPFGKYEIFDKKHPDYSGWSIHNYFFARSVDAVRPGGLVVAITSHFTMDAITGGKIREYLAQKADLVGAIRLPGTAFEKNAGTSVTTDIIILRKKTKESFAFPQEWRLVQEVDTPSGKALVNEYFIKNPEMVLGQHSLEGTMHAGKKEYTLKPNTERPLTDQLAAATEKLPANVFGVAGGKKVHAALGARASEDTKEGLITEKEGKVYSVVEGRLELPPWANDVEKVKQAKEYIKIRNSATDLIKTMLDPKATDEEIKTLQGSLNSLYEKYNKKHGAINGRRSEFLSHDTEFPVALSLEVPVIKVEDKVVKEGPQKGKVRQVNVKEFKKSDIFTKRTLFPFVEPNQAESLTDAVNLSLTYRNGVDPEFVSSLLGKPAEAVRKELIDQGLAFENPETGMIESREEYLSGNVRKKLQIAKDRGLTKNAEALEKVQPQALTIDEIYFRLGSEWIPNDVVETFIKEKMGVDAKVEMVKVQAGEDGFTSWEVNYPSWINKDHQSFVTWGAEGKSGMSLLEDSLNLRRTDIFDVTIDEYGNEKRTRNPAKSLTAQAKQKEIQAGFKEWVLANKEASGKLSQIYNDTKNNYVTRQFETPSIKHYPNASHEVTLRAHQKAGVARGLQGSTIFAHAVGTGKTYLFSTLAMELRRTNQARKPMIIVQGSTLNQFAGQAKRLYPTSRILCPSKQDREQQNRRTLLARIATGDWDMVILPHSFFDGLAVDPKRETAFINEQLAEIEDAIRAEGADPDARGGRNDSLTVKQLRRLLKSKRARLQELANAREDVAIYFENLGVDALLVDEAHYYKRGDFFTKMGNVKGIDRGAAKKSFRFLMKVRAVQEKTKEKNIYLATGTPISNTTAELWTILRYVRPDLLKEYGIEQFDAFASLFGDTTIDIEQTETGDFKQVERFNKYVNGPELLKMWLTAADVILQENVPGWKDVVPRLKDDTTTSIAVPRSRELGEFIEAIKEEREAWDKLPGKEKMESSHVPLVLFTRAKQAAVDLRLVSKGAPDIPGSKVNRAIDEIYKRWTETKDIKGTQLVFTDAYHGPSGFDLYQDIKAKLVKKGIPEQEIAIIIENKYNTDAAKEKLFERVNQGAVRVLVGSTQKLGIGVNVQERLIALHHLDAPPRPMDFEQRNGRILRPGNTLKEVEILAYSTVNTLDSVSFDRLQKKQKFINQVLRGNIQGRNFDDPADELQFTFEDLMAAASGNPLVKKRFGLENRIRELETLQQGHVRKQGNLRHDIFETEEKVKRYEKELEKANQKKDIIEKDFPYLEIKTIEVGGKLHTDPKEGRKALVAAVDEARRDALRMYEETWQEFDPLLNEEKDKKKIEGLAHQFRDRIKGIITTVEAKVNGHSAAFKITTDSNVALWAARKFADLREAAVSINYSLDKGELAFENIHEPSGFFTSLHSKLNSAREAPDNYRTWIAENNKNLANMRKEIEKPFEFTGELEKVQKEYDQVVGELQSSSPTSGAVLPDQVAEEAAPEPASVPFMITKEMETELKAKGFTEEQIRKMTPEEANKALGREGGILRREAGFIDVSYMKPVANIISELLEGYRRPPEVTESKKIIGEYTGSLQVIDQKLTMYAREINKHIPKNRQIAITNYLQAGGDMEILRSRAEQAKPRYKRGYEEALTLTEEEKAWANTIKKRQDEVWAMAHEAGVIESFVENYVRGEWERENKFSKKIISEVNAGILRDKPREALRKTFPTYFEGEALGFAPKNKEIGYQTVAAERSLSYAVAARKALRALMKSKETDGRPTVAIGGAGQYIGGDIEQGEKSAFIVKPNVKPGESYDYKYIDHPSLRKWKWIGKDPEGKNILLEGDMWIHPDAYGRLIALLGKSKVQTYTIPEKVPVVGGMQPGKIALKTGAFIKGTILLGPFHQFHVGEHALFHKVSPFGVPEIDFEKRPILKEGVDHGLMLFNHNALEEFGEGLSTGGLFHRLPGVGDVLTKYQAWLFSDYIPRLKAAMFEHAVKRAEKYYEKKLESGKFTRDQLLDNAAKQANAAFGEQNYRYIGRNPTLQDALRLVLLAPDFLEARLKFAGQAARPYGREQLYALIRGAIIIAATAQILNMLIGDEKKPRWNRPFSLIIGGREYSPRSVVADMGHLITDPRSFWYHRLNPLWGRPLVEIASGRNFLGQKVGAEEAVKDVFKSWVPIPAQGTFRRNTMGETFVDSTINALMQSVGISNYRYRSDFEKYVYGLDRPTFPKKEGEERERQELKEDLENALRRGEPDALQKLNNAIRDKKLTTNEAIRVKNKAKIDPVAKMAKYMSVEELAKGMQYATEEEKKILKPIFRDKIAENTKLDIETKTKYKIILKNL